MILGAAIEGISTAFQSAAGDVKDTMLAVLPYALGVFALSWGVRKAIRFFKSAAN
ncbi:hypothetical protein [Geobacillus sp. LEMMY01]|uniref:hypothetical protein n=1 Tax=Geobacillus sp. LEMMY01 TaxID=1954237 RepID=UPI0015914526|nr:hypothetical protein [Geobacillus sp. LEMMY01]